MKHFNGKPVPPGLDKKTLMQTCSFFSPTLPFGKRFNLVKQMLFCILSRSIPLNGITAETFIVPACVGFYTIRPFGESEGKLCATVKAFVNTDNLTPLTIN